MLLGYRSGSARLSERDRARGRPPRGGRRRDGLDQFFFHFHLQPLRHFFLFTSPRQLAPCRPRLHQPRRHLPCVPVLTVATKKHHGPLKINHHHQQDEVLISGFGRRGHAVGDIPGVRFKVVKVAGVALWALFREKKEKPRN